jgi:alpha-D-xyloside xylohydrolase
MKNDSHLQSCGTREAIRRARILVLCNLAVTSCFSVLIARAQMPGQSLPDQPEINVAQSESGIRATVGHEVVAITVCGDSVIHVVATPGAPDVAAARPRPWMLDAQQSCPGAPFQFAKTDKSASLTTGKLRIDFSLGRGNISFYQADGTALLHEGDSVPRTYEPVEANGEHTWRITDRFAPDATDALYGLGQHQNGMFNYRGATIELGQNNTDVAIPLLVSSKGYAILWNTAALTYIDNRFPLELKFSSTAGESADYYFIYGPEMDGIIHNYRNMTGHTPMLPKWAYGYFQSKDRYVSLDEIQEIAKRYRDEHIPLDGMVQDWFWWKTEGDPDFNANYHDVAKDLDTLHQEHVHAMISVWGLLDPASETYKILDEQHDLVAGAHVYDATNAGARDIYWNRLVGKLLAQGWDAFWLDSAEPEEYWPHFGDAILRTRQLAIGNGAEYTNVFPLLHTLGVQEHWKAANDQKRVFLLTRSAFLGQQRVGATVWSGDVYSTYWGLSHQVPAGLNFALSGYPYWTTDIGGYWPAYEGKTQIADYQELYARWFEFGVFCPIFRSHGHRPENEIWTYNKVEPTLITYDRLRYRLMPYIYSLAWKVSSEDYTIQRPLVMDWRTDPRVHNIGNQFMFGPAILVNPVLEANATSRRLYLPEAAAWYDFWTGDVVKGSQEIEADAPLDRMPLYVRAGSILPLGPEIEYAAQDTEGPLELRIYRGADGAFSLYEDSGDSYDYEKGQHSVIPIHWNDAAAVLTVGTRVGSFPGMLDKRQFRIVLVAKDHGVGESVSANVDREVTYKGKELQVSFH